MSAKILDGRAAAERWKDRTQRDIAARCKRPPCLAVVSVGDDPASAVYIRQKERACAEVGIKFRHEWLGENARWADVGCAINRLNRSPEVDGIILQLPLPTRMAEWTEILVDTVDRSKDVDGLTVENNALRVTDAAYSEFFSPCTPLGIMQLLVDYRLDGLIGKHAVIVGRSDLVGKPLAQMLLGRDATVTICHSKTQDLAAHTRSADLLVVAAGRPGLITADMVKPGAIVIDVGINRVAGKLCGDVDYDGVKEIAGWITPVPGGVGPMTVAALMRNTAVAALRQQEARDG